MIQYRVQFSQQTIEWLTFASEDIREQLKKEIGRLQYNPFRFNTKPNREEPSVRSYRVGHYRIIYVVEAEIRIIQIMDIEREDTYRRPETEWKKKRGPYKKRKKRSKGWWDFG